LGEFLSEPFWKKVYARGFGGCRREVTSTLVRGTLGVKKVKRGCFGTS